MKSKLRQLLQYLDSEQRSKELIEIEYNDELKKIISSDKVVVRFSTKIKDFYFPGLGEMESSEEKIDLIRINSRDRLVIKPKLIQKYLDYAKHQK
jgi:hypothetical protein